MQIVIACGAMSFGPETPSRASLGGSETAALMLAKAIAARGHNVTMFCNLPPEGRPDYFPSGEKHTDGVRYVSLEFFQSTMGVVPVDLFIAVRDPQMVAMPMQARKKVLWAHDIFTKRGMQRALDQMAFTFDEIWCVSEWHKHQIADTTGYPADRIVALRNGIVKHDVLPLDRVQKQLVYASRPERGLENLVKPGGVMEHLPEYKLVVAMYEHFPEHMRDFYEYIFANMKRLPNVEFVGGKPNSELRQIIHDSEAYIYPTQFEETSCILARECIEQGTPFITTAVGALPETLGDCGVFFEEYLAYMGLVEPERGSPGWCMLFAMFVRDALGRTASLETIKNAMSLRTDLYWDGVAEMAEAHFEPRQGTHFSRIWSLIQDGDVIPAIAYYQSVPEDTHLLGEIAEELKLYDFIKGDMAAYYDETYRSKPAEENELHFRLQPEGQRWSAIADQLKDLPPGSRVFEYGCGAGHVLVPLAKHYPNIEFVGYDFAQSCVDLINLGAKEFNVTNVSAVKEPPEPGQFDAVICSEVLEHVVEPWKLLVEVEGYAKVGGKVICTTPYGAWEPLGYEKPGGKKWKERNHLWAIDRQMFVEMLGGEVPGFKTSMIIALGVTPWFRPIGNYLFTYTARPCPPVNEISPLAKALRHHARETCAAVVIAYNNEDTIIKLLNSLEHKVQYCQIAMGPSTDRTEELVRDWFKDRPWFRYNIIDVPKIEAWKFGFDDARNASTKDVEKDCEWMIWIDTDEYLAGDPRKYYRNSALDGYLVAQHHFTVEPRGVPAEVDKPARLIRTDRGYTAKGHIHEHFEVPGDGPGRCMLLQDVDIGHPGYVNEETRRARFFRNFPFLEWEHATEGRNRKLHKFLWLRDIIHRLRFAENPNEKIKLAHEAIEWYNENQLDMATFGPGIFMALKYLGEAYALLGKGVDLKIVVALQDRQAAIEGRFESYQQAEAVLGQLLKDEFKDRTSRYY